MTGAHAHAEAASFGAAMTAAMDAMHAGMHAAVLTGDADQDFLALMIPHHAGAIAMARVVLAHGRDPLTRAFAADMLAAQATEVLAMTARHAALAAGGAAYPALSGTRGDGR